MISESIYIGKDDEDDLIEISNSPITKVLSYTVSLQRKKIILTTEAGFCLVNNSKRTFERFENAKNPFGNETGIRRGSALEQRTEVALVPAKNTKKYSKTTIYIFDHNIQTILYKNDFFLPIHQMTFTPDYLVVGNNKRIILYNYLNDDEEKNQQYYLNMYKSEKPNNILRYFQMHCEEKFANNVITEEEDLGMEEFCMSGTYVISGKKPHKLAYVRVYSINNSKRISLNIYDEVLDKDSLFESFNYQQPFSFTLSEEGDFLAISQNNGRQLKIYDLLNNQLFCQLRVSRSIKPLLSHGFFRVDGSLWYTCTRKSGKNDGNMHIFKITKKSPLQLIESQYKRYVSLYSKTFSDLQIAPIGPDFYVHDYILFSFSLCGLVHDVIDFRRTGNHASKIVENFLKWTEQQ